MDFELTEEQKMIQYTARKFAEKEIKPLATELDRTHRHPAEICAKMGELGLMGITIPEQYGGAGMDYICYALSMIEISKACASCGVIMSVCNSLYNFPVYTYGTEEQKQRFLPPIYRGEVRSWQLLTEPTAGSDLAGVKMTAIRDGDVYVFNGQKIYIGSHHGADRYWTIAVTDPLPFVPAM